MTIDEKIQRARSKVQAEIRKWEMEEEVEDEPEEQEIISGVDLLQGWWVSGVPSASPVNSVCICTGSPYDTPPSLQT